MHNTLLFPNPCLASTVYRCNRFVQQIQSVILIPSMTRSPKWSLPILILCILSPMRTAQFAHRMTLANDLCWRISYSLQRPERFCDPPCLLSSAYCAFLSQCVKLSVPLLLVPTLLASGTKPPLPYTFSQQVAQTREGATHALACAQVYCGPSSARGPLAARHKHGGWMQTFLKVTCIETFLRY
jgi:hypothetical protein